MIQLNSPLQKVFTVTSSALYIMQIDNLTTAVVVLPASFSERAMRTNFSAATVQNDEVMTVESAMEDYNVFTAMAAIYA